MRFSGVSLMYDVGGASVGITLTPLIFPLDSTIVDSPYVLRSVTGLEPPDIDLSILNTLYSGGTFQNRKASLREIVMTIGFQPNYATGQTVGDLRAQLYNWLTPKFGLPVKFSVLDASMSSLVYTLGHVKRFETNIFSSSPEVVITFSTFSPYFTTAPYVYPSLGSLSKTSYTLNNPGDAPTGFSIQITMTGSTSQFNLYDRFANRLYFNYSFIAADTININTTPGNRSATVTRSSVVTNLLQYQNVVSKWLQLHGGPNAFTFNTASYNFDNITLYPNYWGV